MKRAMKWAIGPILSLTMIGVVMMSCSSFGTRPDDTYKLKFKDSLQYNHDKSLFFKVQCYK